MRTAAGLVVLMVLAGSALAAGPDADEAAIRELLKRFDDAHAGKDADGVVSLFASDPDVVLYGPDLADRWVGAAAIRAGMATEFRRLKSIAIEAQPARIHRADDVAWFERLLVMNVTVAEGETSLLARSTGVLRRTGDRWRLVQSHTSVGAPRGQPVEGD